MSADKYRVRFSCLKCSTPLGGSIGGRRMICGRAVLYYKCTSCDLKFKSSDNGPLETVKSATGSPIKDRFKCSNCNECLDKCLSVKTLKDGRKSRYLRCDLCGRKYRHTDGEGLFECKPKKGFNEYTPPLKKIGGLVAGARVFVDGKFVGVAK